ncbi:DUF6545 domain-containing protein [Streptomyces telluris]|uniref:DUF1896 domain-containing protein n=1 Tax=Streptomyces telluris TaxID=2720021 RepID=A0A9X2LNY5_9ACTN|nr:DUF6545 domain-containing protein [Streptomyces telluris]MCQ8774799.1 DUF1896 domain-containing protein [Streptomyces telluris]NJP81066.1 hypothetical protein [Streptomyces telluris]
MVALGYVACKVAAIIAAAAGNYGLNWDMLSTEVGPLFASAGAMLISSGFVYPAAHAWYKRRRDYLALRPLWLAAAEADGNVLLDPMPTRVQHHLAVRDLKWRLTRCLAEIRDAQLAMRVWEDPSVTALAEQRARAAGLSVEETEATAAAATFRAALRTRTAVIDRAARAAVAQGLPLPEVREIVAAVALKGLHGDDPITTAVPSQPGTPTDQIKERHNLVRISRALASPLVEDVLQATAPPKASRP